MLQKNEMFHHIRFFEGLDDQNASTSTNCLLDGWQVSTDRGGQVVWLKAMHQNHGSCEPTSVLDSGSDLRNISCCKNLKNCPTWHWRVYLENPVCHFFGQLGLVLGVKLMEIDRTLFSRYVYLFGNLIISQRFGGLNQNLQAFSPVAFCVFHAHLWDARIGWDKRAGTWPKLWQNP